MDLVPPANTKAGKLINDLQIYGKERKYLEAPVAWFVPITDLKTRIDDVLDFLRFETLHYEEFEVGGGFEFLSEDGNSLGLPPGASFICAMQLAEAIIDIKENDKKEVCIDNDRFMKLSCENGTISMTISHRAKYISPKGLDASAEELKRQMKIARNEWIQFASQLESLLIQFNDNHISSGIVKFMFGLETQNSL